MEQKMLGAGTEFESMIRMIMIQELHRMADSFKNDAVRELEKKMDQIIASVAVDVSRRVSLHRMGSELVITLRLPEVK